MNFKIITELEELPALSTTYPTFCDIEGEDINTDTRLIQFYQPDTIDTIYIFDLAPLGYNKADYALNYRYMKDWLKDLWTVWYDACYDLGVMNLFTKKVDDLLLAVRTSYYQWGSGNFSLDQAVESLGFGHLYGDLNKKELQKKGFVRGAYLSQDQIRYSYTDVYALSLMWKDKRIQAVLQNNMCYKVDMLSMRYAMYYQQNGLIVDHEKRLKELAKYNKLVDEFQAKLPEGLNVNSPKQVCAFLGTDSSNKATLLRYATNGTDKAHYAKTILVLRQHKKKVSYLKSIHHEKMFTKYRIAGAATGRFTANGKNIENGFNAQQIPRVFKKLFKSDTEDTAVVSLDYSTLELRLACAIFEEPNMYEQLMAGEDLHTSMAIETTGKQLPENGKPIEDVETHPIYVTDTDRTKAKSLNFGLVFGMSAPTYKEYAFDNYGVLVTEEEANKLRNTYFSMYPKFKEFHNKIWQNYKDPMFCYKTALGRKTKPKLGTDGINGWVQGTGVEVTKLAEHYLVKEDCERLGLDLESECQKSDAIKYTVNVVHDEITLRVPKKDKDIWVERLTRAMVKGWTEICKTPLMKYKDIPMPVGD